MMFLIILIVIVILLYNSFSKFNSFMRRNEYSLQQNDIKIHLNGDDIPYIYNRACYLMNLQNYPQATLEFNKILHSFENRLLNEYEDELLLSAKENIKFCMKPLPWSMYYPIDKSGSYTHYLLLKLAGNPRSIIVYSD
jgi:hypothetical protein